MSAKFRDVDLAGIDALAAVLRSRRAQQAFQKALKKGQSPTLSLTAAISASLVSAAAKENVEDPLAGLAAVDDLSAFQEDCLPGEKYIRIDRHDHDPDADDFAHGLHGASYRDDPFASRFASRFKADHDDHDAAGGEHCPSVSLTAGQHPSSHAAGALEAHAAHDGHEAHSTGHNDHAVSGEAASHDHAAAATAHEAHDSAPSEQHAAHLSSHEQHDAASASAHAGHDAIVSGGHSAHDMPADALDMDDLAEAVPEQDHGHDMGDAPMAEEEPAAPAKKEEHHASLGDMDMPPAEDLSAGAHNHGVI